MTVSPNAGARPAGERSTAAIGYEFGGYRIDIGSRTLRRGNTIVQLPSRAFDALLHLVEHRDRLIHKNELVDVAWNGVVVTDSSLVHAISVLRKELSDDPSQPKLIQTVARRGYRFLGDVTVVTEQDAAASRADPIDAPAPAKNTDPRRATDRAELTNRWPTRRHSFGIAVLLVGMVALGLSLEHGRQTPSSAGGVQLLQPAPPDSHIVSAGVLSPDGRHLVFVARNNSDGRTSLWLRALSPSAPSRLEGTDGASKPFWAPDGLRIGFFAIGEVMTLSIAGGAAQVIAHDVGGSAAGGSWSIHDQVLFADWARGLRVVPADGGPVSVVANVDRDLRDIAFTWPQFLPDGRHFLYHVTSLNPRRTGTYVGELGSPLSTRVLETDSPAVFAEPGWLLHVKDGMLLAEEFDVRGLQPTGGGMLLARGVIAPSLSDENTIAAGGQLLAFLGETQERNLVWVDRSGAEISVLSTPMVLSNPRLSPDESALLATSSVTSDADLWLASLRHSEFKRIARHVTVPLWAPDGQHIAFVSGDGLYMRSLTVPAGDPIVTSSDVMVLNDWSPDGSHLLYSELTEHSKLDLRQVRLSDGTVTPLLVTPSNETQARVSPTGRWLAYVSDETGIANVYITDYPRGSAKYVVSSVGGGQPQWRADERELFYMAPDRSIFAVDVTATAEGIVLGVPERLFRAPFTGAPNDARDSYVAIPDGTKFLINRAESSAGTGLAIKILINWASTEPPRQERSWGKLIAAR